MFDPYNIMLYWARACTLIDHSRNTTTYHGTWVVCQGVDDHGRYIVIKQQYTWDEHDSKFATLARRRQFRISYFPVN